MNNVKPVILAGGLGSRFRPFTYVVPKPLLPIGERPIIQLTLYWLKSYGFDEVAIALGWRGDLIKAFLGDGSKYGMKIHYVQEEQRMGTAGPLSLLKDWLGQDDLLSINGDLVTKLNLEAFINKHKEERAVMTIASRYHETKLPFGVLETNFGKRVESVTEKPLISHLVSAGVYLLHPKVIQKLDVDQFMDMTTLIAKWSAIDLVSAYVFDEPWIAIEHMGDFNSSINGEWTEWANSLEHRILQLGATK